MNDYIYNQKDIPRKQWRYGFRSSAATGCGWIAIHNALLHMGQPRDIGLIIRHLEHQLPLVNGNTGTFVLGPYFLLKKWGFRVELCANSRRFDELLSRNECALLFYYWKKGLKVGSHFIAVHNSPQGVIGYNVYSNSAGPDRLGPSLTQWVRTNRHFGCVLICISK